MDFAWLFGGRRKFLTVASILMISTVAATVVPAYATNVSANPAACKTMPVLRQGNTGACVALLQQELTKVGYPTTVDGDFGPMTRTNVVKFETAQKLTVDTGVAGPMVWGRLTALIKAMTVTAATPVSAVPANCTQMPRPVLGIGSTGNCVALLQQDLTTDGFPTTVDGRFGPMTRANVIKFEMAKRITVDTGVAGPMVWTALGAMAPTATAPAAAPVVPAPAVTAPAPAKVPAAAPPAAATAGATLPPDAVATPMPLPAGANK